MTIGLVIFILTGLFTIGALGWTTYAGHPTACDDVVGEIVVIREAGPDGYGNYNVVFTVRYQLNDEVRAETFDMDADQFYATPLVVGDRLEMQVVQFNRFPPHACLGQCHYGICWDGE
jgi:hypothetical protein